MGQHGGSRHRRGTQNNQGPYSFISMAAFNGRGCRGEEFLRQLPERARQGEETAFIVDIFSHAAQVHEHLSEVCANVTALAKITDKMTLMTVINGAVWPLVQLNVPEGFLNPVEDKKALTSEEEKKEKVKKTVLPIPDATCLKHEPRNSSSMAQVVPQIF